MDFRIESIKDKESVKAYIDKLPEGKPYDVIVKVHRRKRTIPQNDLYWLWLTLMSDELGEDKEYYHLYFRKKYLGYITTEVLDDEISELRSTTSLNTKQFSEYLKKIDVFANAEMGILLPHPEDEYWNSFYDKYEDRI